MTTMTNHIEKTTKLKRLGTLNYTDYACKCSKGHTCRLCRKYLRELSSNHREKNRILKEINEMETDT